MIADLDSRAAAQGVTRSELIREFIDRGLSGRR
jgi:Ribbon-helix-helix protein, copG family